MKKPSQMIAQEIRRRVHAVAKALIEPSEPRSASLGGKTPVTEDVTEEEQKVAARLAELWKQGETAAGARVVWVPDPRGGSAFKVSVRRANLTVENV